jgi:hypothetical protein
MHSKGLKQKHYVTEFIALSMVTTAAVHEKKWVIAHPSSAVNLDESLPNCI